jgi:hypothetical protein
LIAGCDFFPNPLLGSGESGKRVNLGTIMAVISMRSDVDSHFIRGQLVHPMESQQHSKQARQ